jgi:hypothetical protein
VISLCRYSQHDLSASGFGAYLVFHDGSHFSGVFAVAVGGCVGVSLAVVGFLVAVVAIYGVIFGGCCCFSGTAIVTCFFVAIMLFATCRASISSSSSTSSSSDSGCSVGSSVIFVVVVGIPFYAFNFINSLAHGVEPSMSSICLSLLLVLVI